MTVKAVILDLDGTLLTDNTTNTQPGIPRMIQELRDAGLRIVIASNRGGVEPRIASAGLYYDLLLTRSVVGVNKGSPLWVDSAVSALGIGSNEIAWLGDSDGDMRSASHARIVYFNAGWSTPSYPYGINVASPTIFGLILRECFTKPINWYWELDGQDTDQRSFSVKAIIDGNGAGITAIRNDLLNFLKYGGDPSLGLLTVREFMMLHLMGSIYGDGMHQRADTWTIYPGSQGGPNNAMQPFVQVGARLFRDRYVEDLLLRHTPSMDSGQSRSRGIQTDFTNQVNTVMLNPNHRNRIEDRTVVVVDDFCTRGYSSECARNLLYRAGASEVISVNVGKYGLGYYAITPRAGHNWDSYAPTPHSASDFRAFQRNGKSNTQALDLIRTSYVGASQVTP